MSDLYKLLRYLSRDDQDMTSVYCGKALEELEAKDAEIEHWKGMTKGRESEIDKHLAEIERLRSLVEVKNETIKARESEIARAYKDGERLRQTIEYREATIKELRGE